MRYLVLLVLTATLISTSCEIPKAIPAPEGKPNPTATIRAPDARPSPTAVTPNTLGSYDDAHDFRAFAASMAKAIETADVQFFLDNVTFADLKCDVDFPEPPKSCNSKPKGATVQGIVAGVWASEGFGLDADGYREFIGEFLQSFDAGASDTYGTARPQLYSYGIFKPELQGSSTGLETVQAFTTRIASGQRFPPPGRSVLVFHVSFGGNKWSITRLLVTPQVQQYPPAAALLDPSRPEARDILLYWKRWEP